MALPIEVDPRLSERRLGIIAPDSAAFEAAVRRTWDNPDFCYPGGESNREAQARGMALIEELQRACGSQHIVLATHGNLLALILQAFDPTIGFNFWSALTMPDSYRLRIQSPHRAHYRRLWRPWPEGSGAGERDPT
jgi:2,3-bisphosphoglycerate-dependent phosphoglycerate mutase